MKKFLSSMLALVLCASFSLTTVEASFTDKEFDTTTKVTKATPNVRTIKNLMLTSVMPIGTTMYIYGGAWNEEDTGAGVEARTIGLVPKWAEFASKQNSTYNQNAYDYEKDRSVIHLGIDCSGFIGWTLYNVFNSESNGYGMVYKSSDFAKNLSKWGYGTFTPRAEIKDYKAGDIMSTKGHVWMAVGQCADGSVVLVHSSGQGPTLSGTYTKSGNKNSQAIQLATKYMKEYYPQWYSNYPNNIARDANYLNNYDQFRWNDKYMGDAEGYRNMTVDQVLEDMFNTTENAEQPTEQTTTNKWWLK